MSIKNWLIIINIRVAKDITAIRKTCKLIDIKLTSIRNYYSLIKIRRIDFQCLNYSLKISKYWGIMLRWN